MSGTRGKVITAALWAVAIAGTTLLAWRRYHVAGNVLGTDFQLWLTAARDIAAGRSPYVPNAFGSFVYPPTLAALLAPFVHARPVHLWNTWTGLEIAALVLAVAAFVSTESRQLLGWRRPALFGFCAFTVLHFWPVGIGVFYGQSDAFAFAALMVAGLAASRARPGTRGAWIGIAGLIKGWPAAAGLALFQRGLADRRRAVIGFVVAVLVAPASIIAVGGLSGLRDFVTSNFDARSQHLASASVWGAPKLLFTHTPFARPVTVSSSLRVVVTAMLAAWVVGLLITAIRTPGDPALCTWNVTLCIVLLLPVSHVAYTLYGLPLLWVWSARALARAPRWNAQEIAAVAVLVVWWLVQFQRRTNQDLGPDPALLTSARYCVVFAANLIACTFSVLGARSATSTARPDRASCR